MGVDEDIEESLSRLRAVKGSAFAEWLLWLVSDAMRNSREICCGLAWM